jgi:hypothetical protein
MTLYLIKVMLHKGRDWRWVLVNTGASFFIQTYSHLVMIRKKERKKNYKSINTINTKIKMLIEKQQHKLYSKNYIPSLWDCVTHCVLDIQDISQHI